MTFEEQLEKTGRLVYTNKGVSMMPLIREGRDVMIIEACSIKDIKKFDAVLFTRKTGDKTTYVLHRVLKLNSNGSFFIAGDNCTGGENVAGEQILGRLTGIIRDGKRTDTADKKYLLYVHIWCDLYPLRFKLLKIRGFVKRCIGYAKRRIRNEG